MRARLLAGAMVVLLASCGSGSPHASPPSPRPKPKPKVHNLSGTLTLTDPADAISPAGPKDAGNPCVGTNGMEDIDEGARIVISHDGTTLAVGGLDAGSIVGTYPNERCVFDFTILSVPDSPFYDVEVSHRGKVTFSRAEVAKDGWSVDVTL